MPGARPKPKTPSNPPGLRDLPFSVPEVSSAQKSRARRLMARLAERYPDAHCELNYSTPHELLIATILSAQSTDAGVNKATPGLFAAFPTPADYAVATPAQIETHISTVGLYRNKAKSIHAAMTRLVEHYNAEVPADIDELLSLRGVARKTANVVLGDAFGIAMGVVVDTHVERLSKRFGLAPEDATVAMTERYLCAQLPRTLWTQASHLLIFHGRRASKARGWDPTADPIDRTYAATYDEVVARSKTRTAPRTTTRTRARA
ncbi:MAG: endonuclease III [Planctomycetota bacterium]